MICNVSGLPVSLSAGCPIREVAYVDTCTLALARRSSRLERAPRADAASVYLERDHLADLGLARSGLFVGTDDSREPAAASRARQ
jgi:hypothetical protein